MMKIIEDVIEEKLLYLHTAFLAKVISTDGKTAKIQPLNMIKQKGEQPIRLSPIEDVPILDHVKKYKIERCPCSTVENPKKHVEWLEIEAGDIVYCLCCERDITEARKGKEALPVTGHHQIQDAIIIGLLGSMG